MESRLGPDATPCKTTNGETTQANRVKRAWRAIRKLGSGDKEGNNLATIWAEADYTAMRQIIAEAKRHFWERYKIIYPVKIAPADKLLFTCYKEMEERRLTCYDIRKVKSILEEAVNPTEQPESTSESSQEQQEPKRRKVAATPTPHGVREYMAKLYTYLLALAIVGTHKVHGAPPEEAFGSDSTMFVQTPWDILQAYYFQVTRSVITFPEASRLAWLERTDIAERSVWVPTFRDGEGTIGVVIRQTMDRRGAYWDPPAYCETGHTGFTKGLVKQGKQRAQSRRQYQSPMKTPRSQPRLTPGSVSTIWKDRKTLGLDSQKGDCHIGTSCQNGLHGCNQR